MNNETPEELAREALKPGRFNFADALKGRSYPSLDVDIWLDEEAAFPLLDLDDKIAEAKGKIARLPIDEDSKVSLSTLNKNLKALEGERAKIKEILEPSKYVFTVRGVDPGTQEDLFDKALADYPYEYDEYFNPITGQKVRDEKPNSKRDRLYTNLLWTAHVVKIVSPDGDEDVAPEVETIAAARRIMPRAATHNLSLAMDKVDMSVDWFNALSDESFLAKS